MENYNNVRLPVLCNKSSDGNVFSLHNRKICFLPLRGKKEKLGTPLWCLPENISQNDLVDISVSVWTVAFPCGGEIKFYCLWSHSLCKVSRKESDKEIMQLTMLSTDWTQSGWATTRFDSLFFDCCSEAVHIWNPLLGNNQSRMDHSPLLVYAGVCKTLEKNLRNGIDVKSNYILRNSFNVSTHMNKFWRQRNLFPSIKDIYWHLF